MIYPAFGIIQRAEALDTHRRAGLYPSRRAEYGEDVRGRLDSATEVTVEQYLAASADRRACAGRLRPPLRLVRGAADPGERRVAPPDRRRDRVHDGEELTFRELVMSYTTPQDLVGLPACAVRAGFDALGIPVGVQFTAAPWREDRALRAAQGLFDATPNVQSRQPTL